MIFFENHPELPLHRGPICVCEENWDILNGVKTRHQNFAKLSGIGVGPGAYRPGRVASPGKFEISRHEHVHFPIGLTWAKNSNRLCSKTPRYVLDFFYYVVHGHPRYSVARNVSLSFTRHVRHVGDTFSHVNPMAEMKNIFQIEIAQNPDIGFWKFSSMSCSVPLVII